MQSGSVGLWGKKLSFDNTKGDPEAFAARVAACLGDIGG